MIKHTSFSNAVICAALWLFLTPQLAAQDNTAAIGVSTTVLIGLSVEAAQSLLLGDIVAGETKRIELDGAATGSQPGEEQAGVFRINTPGSFTVSFSEVPTSLTRSGGGDGNPASLPITFFAAWNDALTPPNTGNIVNVTPNTTTPIIINGNSTSPQNIYIFLGAELSPPNEQTIGVYEGTITITAIFGVE